MLGFKLLNYLPWPLGALFVSEVAVTGGYIELRLGFVPDLDM